VRKCVTILFRRVKVKPAESKPFAAACRLAATTLLLSGCVAAAANFEAPIELTGMVSNPVFTGWYKNFCEGGHLTVSPDCLQVGGEIYKVTFSDVRTEEGRRASRTLIIGFPAHGLPRTYRSREHIRLEKSPEDFRLATGVEYLAGDWDDAKLEP
jgi:hypothetical protein